MMRTIADKMAIISRHQHNWPVNVVAIARELGLRAFRAEGWPDEVSGQIKKDQESPSGFSIFVNASHHINRQRFTIAHEIAHYILHEEMIGDGVTDDALYRSRLSGPMETEANKLAADILMPWHLVHTAMQNGMNTLEELARAFEVSKSAMAIRIGAPYETAA